MARQKKAMKNENRIRTPATSAIPPLQLERLQRITLISPQCPICIVPIFNNLFVQHTHKHSVSDDSLSNASGWEQATWCFNHISLQLFLLSSSKFHLPHTEEPLIRWTVLNTAVWTHSLSEEHDPGRRKTKRKTRTGCNENSRIKQRLDLFYWEKALCTHTRSHTSHFLISSGNISLSLKTWMSFRCRFTPAWHPSSDTGDQMKGHISSPLTHTIIRRQLAIMLHLMQIDGLVNQHMNGKRGLLLALAHYTHAWPHTHSTKAVQTSPRMERLSLGRCWEMWASQASANNQHPHDICYMIQVWLEEKSVEEIL